MKVFKKMFFSLLTVLFLLTGCSTQVKEIEDFVEYEYEKYDMKFQHPEWWVAFDGSLSSEEIQGILSFYGADMDAIIGQIEGVDFNELSIWYDFQNQTETIVPNLVINSTQQPGVTQKDLSSEENIVAFSDEITTIYTSVFPNFSLLKEVEAEKLGKNTFLTVEYEYSLNSDIIKGAQGITVHNNNMIVFTLTTTDERFEEDIELFRTLLETVIFN